MKTIRQGLQHIAPIGALAGTLACLTMTATPGFADDAPISPISIKATLMTPAIISLGEPILMHYEVSNTSGQTEALQLGLDGTDWYTLSLQDAQGRTIPTIPIPHPAPPHGAFTTQDGFYRNGESSGGYIPVSRFVTTPGPGNYTLTVHANLSYALTGDSKVGWSETWTAASGLKVMQDITFPIRVTNADSRRIHATAEALLKAVSDPATDAHPKEEMDELFSMPEAQASSIWRELALKPSMSNDLVAGELEGLHSKVGVDILIQMMDTPGLICTSVSDRLNVLYNTSDGVLRKYIKSVALQHGIVMSEVAPIAISID